MNVDDQRENDASPERSDDVFEFGDRTILTLRRQELHIDENEPQMLSRETIAAELPPLTAPLTATAVPSVAGGIGDETMVVTPSCVASPLPGVTPSIDPGDETIVAVPPAPAVQALQPIETAAGEEPAERRFAQLEQKLDTSIRLMQAMQHRLDSIDAALARILHR